ncbi:hypothetical protein OAY83_00460 [Candidatus Marinimicrobia bacterium]|nr:hypothetical protein [Candidatus Neomarinimicrobiota bacterium]
MRIGNIILFALFTLSFNQSNYSGPNDKAGDPSAIKESWMDGNSILLYFKNTSELSDWAEGGLDNVSIWPNDGTGTRMVDGIGLLIGAKTYILDDEDSSTIDTIIIDNFNDIINPDVKKHEVYFLQTQYREEMDQNSTGTLDWGFYPVFGYFNPNQDYPAMSDDPDTWPSAGWPSSGNDLQWKGFWDGRFGKGVTYADLETYFVINDAQDQENLDRSDYRYYPRPGYFIQEDASVQSGLPWGGLGLRVEARGFQWNNPLVKDALFWEYNITNISEYNINEVAFGYWVDNAIGGESTLDDEVGYFDTNLDLSYSWDYNGIGEGASEPGIMGFAYLESPGIPDDLIDNDNDGIIDEKRDNDKGSLVCGTCGISDINKYKEFYGYTDDDLGEHWSGDEDQDWVSSIVDDNGNCVVNDDVGLDGIGPSDINYIGPDDDGTECNQEPDCEFGVGCEPNFGETDVSESDMIGLTTFQLFPVDSHSQQVDKTSKWFYNDDIMFEMMSSDTLMQYADTPDNLIEIFASGTFKLEKGRTERISMAELHSSDYLTGSPGGTQPNAPALFELKKTVQLIYETDYRFAQPPITPTLTADAQDGKIILTWDSNSENSRDPFLPDSLQYDFEGYKLYKSTDKYLRDSQIITDGYGNPMFNVPIFQCDKIDGITGFADWAPIFGTSYYVGDDSGLVHEYIDTDVINGRTYYYALVAYDYGLEATESLSNGIPPSENNVIIELDENEYVISTGPNVVEVYASSPSAGYENPSIETYDKTFFGTGTIDVNIFSPDQIKDNSIYYVTFINDTLFNFQYNDGFPEAIVTSGIEIFKEMADSLQLIYTEFSGTNTYNNPNFNSKNIIESEADLDNDGLTDISYWSLNTQAPVVTGVFDGLQLTINQGVEYPKIIKQGWKSVQNNTAQLFIMPFPDVIHRQSLVSPLDADIYFTENVSYTNEMQFGVNVYDENFQNIPSNQLLLNEDFNFYVYSETIQDTLSMIVHDLNFNDIFDYNDRVLVGTKGDFTFNGQTLENIWKNTNFIIEFNGLDDFQLPQSGDVYEIKYNRPFWETDTLKIVTQKNQTINSSIHNSDMERIKVVPNPYVGTNLLEESIFSSSFNQRRKLMFTHLPSQCVIKILTSSGVLVDVIEVNNSINDGVAYWDLTSNEGMEIASGIYFYHVKSNVTGKEKIGKFVVVK